MEFQKVGPFLVHIGSFCFEDFVEALALQAATGHGEVDEGHPGAEVRGNSTCQEGRRGSRSASSRPAPYPSLPRLRGVGSCPGPYGGIASGQEDDEGRRQVDVLVAERDQHSAPCPPDFTVQNWVQNGVVALHILRVCVRCR